MNCLGYLLSIIQLLILLQLENRVYSNLTHLRLDIDYNQELVFLTKFADASGCLYVQKIIEDFLGIIYLLRSSKAIYQDIVWFFVCRVD